MRDRLKWDTGQIGISEEIISTFLWNVCYPFPITLHKCSRLYLPIEQQGDKIEVMILSLYLFLYIVKVGLFLLMKEQFFFRRDEDTFRNCMHKKSLDY